MVRRGPHQHAGPPGAPEPGRLARPVRRPARRPVAGLAAAGRRILISGPLYAQNAPPPARNPAAGDALKNIYPSPRSTNV